MKKNWLSFVLAAVVFAAAPIASAFDVTYPLDGRDILQQLEDLHTRTALLEPEDVAFFDPDTADLNGNLVLDAHELDIFVELVNPGSAIFDSAVQAIFEANADQVEADFGALLVGLAPETILFGAALATMNGPTDFPTVLEIAAFASDFVQNQPEAANYNLTSTKGSVCGDPDGDGVPTINEITDAGDALDPSCTACVANSIAPGTSNDGGDVFRICDAGAFSFPLEGLVYEPVSERVFLFVEGDTGVTWQEARDAAQSLQIAGIDVDDADLAAIDTQEISDLFVSKNWDGWAGGSDAATEDTWIWVTTGQQFWQGKADGSGVGAFFPTPDDGEPNGDTEDFFELKSDGTWNDKGATSTEDNYIVEVGTFADSNADGLPDAFADNNNDGAPDGLGIPPINVSISVTAGDAGAVVPGGDALQLSVAVTGALSNDPPQWSVDNAAVANLSPATGSNTNVFGTSAGTATVTVSVTGQVDDGVGGQVESTGQATLDITVISPQWFDLCDLQDTFDAQGSAVATIGGDALGLPSDFADWDIELGAGDGVPDSAQLRLLAYVLCQEGIGSKTDGSDVAAATYSQNLAQIQSFLADSGAVLGYFSAIQANETALLTLAGTVQAEAGVCDVDLGAGLTLSQMIGAAATGGGGGLTDLIETLTLVVALFGFSDFLAGAVSLSTEMQLTIGALVPSGDLNDVNLLLQGFEGYMLALAGGVTGCSGGAQAQAAALVGTLGITGAPPQFDLADLAFTVADLGSKAVGEPFSGAGDLNSDGITNAECWSATQGAGGDVDDFIACATGEFGAFFPGNPGLPVGGMIGFTAMSVAMAAAGAMGLRRRK